MYIGHGWVLSIGFLSKWVVGWVYILQMSGNSRCMVALLYYRTLQSVKIESVKIKSAKKQVWLKMLKIA